MQISVDSYFFNVQSQYFVSAENNFHHQKKGFLPQNAWKAHSVLDSFDLMLELIKLPL